MYTLYARNGAGSMAPEALLAACGADYKVIVVERNPDGSFPEYFHRINPKAEVPTLVLPDDSVMTESAAMMIYLADLFPAAGLAPGLGSASRARYLRWQVYLAATIYMSDLRLFYPARFSTDPAAADGIKAKAAQMMNAEFAIYAAALGEGPFILGAAMSAADIYAAMLCTWAPDKAALFATHPSLHRMYEAVLSRPEIRAVWTRNGE